MDIKKRKEILKGWAEHKGFEFFMEDIGKILDKNRDSLSSLDLFDEKDRSKGIKMQSNIIAINSVLDFISNYSKQAKISSPLESFIEDNL